jgi:hypothetical protein
LPGGCARLRLRDDNFPGDHRANKKIVAVRAFLAVFGLVNR